MGIFKQKRPIEEEEWDKLFIALKNEAEKREISLDKLIYRALEIYLWKHKSLFVRKKEEFKYTPPEDGK